jgi:hypothetical protein
MCHLFASGVAHGFDSLYETITHLDGNACGKHVVHICPRGNEIFITDPKDAASVSVKTRLVVDQYVSDEVFDMYRHVSFLTSELTKKGKPITRFYTLSHIVVWNNFYKKPLVKLFLTRPINGKKWGQLIVDLKSTPVNPVEDFPHCYSIKIPEHQMNFSEMNYERKK